MRSTLTEEPELFARRGEASAKELLDDAFREDNDVPKEGSPCSFK
jgi:hypothetical protein